MELTAERRKETGAFYTPYRWAELAMYYVERIVPDCGGYRWRDRPFVFYDPAAGEGALLAAANDHYGGCLTAGTTLEAEDVAILRGKGVVIAGQSDFLSDKPIRGIVPAPVLAAAMESRLVVLTNPPFEDAPAGRYEGMRRRYGTANKTELFISRILHELRPVLLCSFSKLGVLTGARNGAWRRATGLMDRIVPGGCFVCRSRTWPGLRGDFPILFACYSGIPGCEGETRRSITVDVWERPPEELTILREMN